MQRSDVGPETTANEDVLSSWKEIAAYLGRNISTVQRWEKMEGLPVHRHFHQRKGSVQAFKTELDAWRGSRTLAPSEEDGNTKETETVEDEPLQPQAEPAVALVWRWRLAAVISFLLLGTIAALVGFRTIPPPSTPAALSPSSLFAHFASERAMFQTVPVGGRPDQLFLWPRNHEIYLSVVDSADLVVVDTRSLLVTQRIPIGGVPKTMVAGADGRSLFVANGKGGLHRVDLHTKSVISIGTPHEVIGIAVTPDGKKLFATMGREGMLSIDLSNFKAHQVPGMVCPMYPVMDASTDRLYIICRCGGPGGKPGHDAIDILDPRTEKSVGTIRGLALVGGNSALSPLGTLWVDGSDACLVPHYDRIGCPLVPGIINHVIRTSDNEVLTSLGFPPPGIRGFRFLPDGRAIQIVPPFMRVIHPISFKVLEEYRVFGNDAVIDPDGDRLYLASAAPNALLVIPTRSKRCETDSIGRLAWLSADGHSRDVNSAHAMLLNGASLVPGLFGHAFGFDGIDDSLTFGAHDRDGLDVGLPGTLSYWFKPNRVHQRQALVSTRGETVWRLDITEEGRLELSLAAGSMKEALVVSSPIKADRWHHVAITVAEAGVALFLNGVEQSPGLVLSAARVDLRWRQTSFSPDPQHPFAGKVDELAMYSNALDTAAIRQQYEAGIGSCLAPDYAVKPR